MTRMDARVIWDLADKDFNIVFSGTKSRLPTGVCSNPTFVANVGLLQTPVGSLLFVPLKTMLKSLSARSQITLASIRVIFVLSMIFKLFAARLSFFHVMSVLLLWPLGNVNVFRLIPWSS